MSPKRLVVVVILVAAASLLGAGCSSSPQVTTIVVGGAAGSSLGTALDHGPIPEEGGSDFVADDAALWYATDRGLARYDVGAQRWSVIALPFRKVSIIAIVRTGKGRVVGLAGTCDIASCETEGPQPLTLHAFRADATSATEVAIPRRIAFTTSDPIDVVGSASEGPGLFLVGPSVISVGSTGSVTITEPNFPMGLVCSTRHGFVGLALGQAPVSPLPLPPSLTVVMGSTLTRLGAVKVDARVDPDLQAKEWGSACLDDGLALIGPHAAWEFSAESRTWTAVASDVGKILYRQTPSHPGVRDRRGAYWVPGELAGNLMRDHAGWHLVPVDASEDPPSVYGISHGELILYPSLEIRRRTAAQAHLPTVSAPEPPLVNKTKTKPPH